MSERNTTMNETTHLTPGATAEGECLLCGHWMRFKVWNDLTGTGICEGCFDGGKVNRGPCSPERGCDCGTHGLAMTADRRAQEIDPE